MTNFCILIGDVGGEESEDLIYKLDPYMYIDNYNIIRCGKILL